jgi:hypothetical protein
VIFLAAVGPKCAVTLGLGILFGKIAKPLFSDGNNLDAANGFPSATGLNS